MKKLLLIMLATPFTALAQEGSFTVQGNVGTFSAPAKVYLDYEYGGKEVIDSAVLKNGKFSFTGKVAKPSNAYLIFDPNGKSIHGTRDYRSFYIENGVIEVTSADAIANAKVSGTKTNQENELYRAALQPVNDAYAALEAKQKAATPEQQQSEDFSKANNKAEKAIEKQETEINKKFIQDHPGSYISLDALQSYAYGADYADVAPLFEALSPEIKQTEDGKKFAERLPKLKAVALGTPAPVFAEADTSGKIVSLSSFKGKYVLVDFWASWCGPCRAENPNVVKAFNKYKDKNFTIIGVSLDRPNGKQKWLDAIHKDHLTWTHVSDLQFWKSKTADMYGVRAIPQNFLVGPDGKIVAKNLRGDDLNDKLAELFGKI